jgi:demethylspheroidene O-methyltransferase
VPGLQLTLFDLPAVAELARLRLAGLGDRARAVGGSFLTEPLPGGADVISLVRVVHDHDDPQALTILRAVRSALPPGGVVLLAEPMAETAGAEPVGDAYFGFYLLAMGQGRPRTATALIALLQQAGFVNAKIHRTRTPLLTRVISATVNHD